MQKIDTGQDKKVLDTIDETAAADTLHPGAGSGGSESRASMLSTFTQLLAQLGKEDLSDLFNQVQDQYKPNGPLNGVDGSGQNKGTLAPGSKMVAPMMSVKEDVEEMFSSDELSEEFKERAEIVFEAALNTRLTVEMAKLEEDFEAKEAELTEAFDAALEEKTFEIFEDLSNNLNKYLDYAVTEWVEENSLAIDNGLRAEIAEGFIAGLHTLFSEHYIKVPESELDIVSEMKDEIDNLKAALNEVVDENLELKSIVSESTKESIIDQVSEGMVLTQAARLRELSENVDFVSPEVFKKKVEVIKETYFGAPKTAASTLINEEVVSQDNIKVSSPDMNAYENMLSKSVKN